MFYLIFDNLRKRNLFLGIFNFFTFLFIIIPLFLVVKNAILPSSSGWLDNFSFVNSDLLFSLVRSFWVSIFSVLIVFAMSYPFAYFVVFLKNKFYRSMLIALITSPLWTSFFVKLIGLKSFFDLCNGSLNSTVGLIYVIVGLVYINLPISILSFYSILKGLPKNLLSASLDLGHGFFSTIFRIVIPYTKEAIFSSVFLVFLPSFTSVSIADFMNSGNSSKLVGQLIYSYSSISASDSINTHRLSFTTLFLIFIVVILYFLFKFIPDFFKEIRKLKSD